MGLDFLKNHGAQRTIPGKGSNPYAIIPTDQLRGLMIDYKTMQDTGIQIGTGKPLQPGAIQTIGKEIIKIESELFRRERATWAD